MDAIDTMRKALICLNLLSVKCKCVKFELSKANVVFIADSIPLHIPRDELDYQEGWHVWPITNPRSKTGMNALLISQVLEQ